MESVGVDVLLVRHFDGHHVVWLIAFLWQLHMATKGLKLHNPGTTPKILRYTYIMSLFSWSHSTYEAGHTP